MDNKGTTLEEKAGSFVGDAQCFQFNRLIFCKSLYRNRIEWSYYNASYVH